MIVQKGQTAPGCSADNVLDGVVARINPGKVNTEMIVRLASGTEVCSLMTTRSCRRLGLAEGDPAQVCFNGFAVVLLAE